MGIYKKDCGTGICTRIWWRQPSSFPPAALGSWFSQKSAVSSLERLGAGGCPVHWNWQQFTPGKEREVSEVTSESIEMMGKEIGQTNFRKNSGIFFFCKGDAEGSYQPSTDLQEALAAAQRTHLRLPQLWTCLLGFLGVIFVMLPYPSLLEWQMEGERAALPGLTLLAQSQADW